ncbi:MAG: S8 family serine peptidase, partial [Acidimicrobiia bacterium]|nr:S8 family serine peptidase [Acidimicrobiia bacterium]
IDATHPALVGKVLYEACFTNQSCDGGASVARGQGTARPCTFGSQCDHGTHVAGIAAGRHATYSGMAPGAGLIAFQVFSRSTNPAECGVAPVPCPRARASDVLAALEEAYTLRSSFPGIVAVNMSLSSDSAQADCSASVLRTAVDKLRAEGIATIVASGNGGSQNGLGVPACIPSTISVGATQPDGGSIWQLTNISDQLDLVAPGVGVVSPAPGGGFSGTTGTSAAAPVVAGAWALASEALGTNDVGTIEAALEQSATPVPYGTEGRTVDRLDLGAIGGSGAAFGPQELFVTMAGASDQAGPGYQPLRADFNGDGLGDVLWYHQNGSDWMWTATGGGRFAGSVTPEIPAGYRPVAGDFNGDTLEDVFLFGPGNLPDWVWFSTGSSAHYMQFWGVQSYQISGDWQVFPGDFNDDGRGDVFLFSASNGDNHIWYGTGGTAPATQFWGAAAYPASGPYKPVTGDFNADGVSDIFWYGPGDHSDWLWFGTGSMAPGGQFRDMEVFGVTGDYQLHSGDFNGDGRTDLLFYLPGPADDQIWFNQADGSFRGVVMKVDARYTPVVGNFDGDGGGKADIFWASDPIVPADVMWLSK